MYHIEVASHRFIIPALARRKYFRVTQRARKACTHHSAKVGKGSPPAVRGVMEVLSLQTPMAQTRAK